MQNFLPRVTFKLSGQPIGVPGAALPLTTEGDELGQVPMASNAEVEIVEDEEHADTLNDALFPGDVQSLLEKVTRITTSDQHTKMRHCLLMTNILMVMRQTMLTGNLTLTRHAPWTQCMSSAQSHIASNSSI